MMDIMKQETGNVGRVAGKAQKFKLDLVQEN